MTKHTFPLVLPTSRRRARNGAKAEFRRVCCRLTVSRNSRRPTRTDAHDPRKINTLPPPSTRPSKIDASTCKPPPYFSSPRRGGGRSAGDRTSGGRDRAGSAGRGLRAAFATDLDGLAETSGRKSSGEVRPARQARAEIASVVRRKRISLRPSWASFGSGLRPRASRAHAQRSRGALRPRPKRCSSTPSSGPCPDAPPPPQARRLHRRKGAGARSALDEPRDRADLWRLVR
jgi:hypothetical protein